MISNQVLQSTIEGIKSIAHADLCVLDVEGKVLATTITDAEGFEAAAAAFVDSPADSQVMQGNQFFKVFDDRQLEYIIVVRGDSDDVYMMGKLASFQISSLIVAYKERYDKDNFIKNLLLDNLLHIGRDRADHTAVAHVSSRSRQQADHHGQHQQDSKHFS